MVFWVLLCFETGANLLTDRQMGQPIDRQTNPYIIKVSWIEQVFFGKLFKTKANQAMTVNDWEITLHSKAYCPRMGTYKKVITMIDNEAVEVFKIKYVPFTHLKHKQADTTHYYSS